MLKEFRRCPAHYRSLTMGLAKRPDSDALRFGRAVHKMLLEGEAAFRAAFTIGGPINEKTGRSFGSGTKAFANWLSDNGMNRAVVITPSELEDIYRMREAARSHREIARLFSEGWAERSARASLEGVDCQIRLDWLRGDGIAVDLKTVDDITHFEADARRFGYLHQFAFYCDIARAAGGVPIEIIAIVLEKREPFRAGVWNFPPDVLAPYSAQNREAIKTLRRCRETNRWPTGYEKPRRFPLSGIPPVWLN